MAFRLRREGTKSDKGECTSSGLKMLIKRSLPAPHKQKNSCGKHHPSSHDANFTIVKVPSRVKKPRNFLSRNRRSSISSDQHGRPSSGLEDKSDQHGFYEQIHSQFQKSTPMSDAKMTSFSKEVYDPDKLLLKDPAPAVCCGAQSRSSHVPSGISIDKYISGGVVKLKRLPTEGTYLTYQSGSEREVKMKCSSFRDASGKGRRRSSTISDMSDEFAPSIKSRRGPSMEASVGGGELNDNLDESDIFEESELSELFAARAALMAFAMSDDNESSLERIRDSFCS